MKYIVVKASTVLNLTEQVNTKIREGYTPLGGVTTEIYPGFEPLYLQSMSNEKADTNGDQQLLKEITEHNLSLIN